MCLILVELSPLFHNADGISGGVRAGAGEGEGVGGEVGENGHGKEKKMRRWESSVV